jgi:hypothetical protein
VQAKEQKTPQTLPSPQGTQDTTASETKGKRALPVKDANLSDYPKGKDTSE